MTRDQELYFANAIISTINNVKIPMLIYEEEKEVVKKALCKYIDEIESEMRGR